MRPDSSIVIDCSLPVPLSFAETVRMPFASMSNVTSIWGTPAGARLDALQTEFADRLVVARHRALALKHVDFHARLERRRRREDLRVMHGERRVALHDARRHAADGLKGKGKRRHVEQQDGVRLHKPRRRPRERSPLDGRAHGDALVGVDRRRRLLPRKGANLVLNRRDARRPADKQHASQLGGGKPASLSAWDTGPSVRSTKSAVMRLNSGARDPAPPDEAGRMRPAPETAGSRAPSPWRTAPLSPGAPPRARVAPRRNRDSRRRLIPA